jgi:hypothetical protein
MCCRCSPFGHLTTEVVPSMLTVTPAGSVIGFLPMRDMFHFLRKLLQPSRLKRCRCYQISQSTSPPMPRIRHWCPVRIPWFVDRIEMP